MSFAINTLFSSWGQSVLSTKEATVSSASDLDKVEITEISGLERLSSEDREAANKKYSSFRKATDAVANLFRSFDAQINAINDLQKYYDSYDRRYETPREVGDEMVITRPTDGEVIETQITAFERYLPNIAEQFFQAKYEEAQHEQAIITAKNANAGVMPDSYRQPRSAFNSCIIL